MGGEVVMLARAVPEIPDRGDLSFEPKLDGWRAITEITPWKVRVTSRRGRPLAPYFPELVEAAGMLPAGTVLDGELIVPADGGADFAALQHRIRPSEQRAGELARTTPAALVAFDLTRLRGRDLRSEPYEVRRAALVELLADVAGPIGVMPMTTDRAAAAPSLDGRAALGPGRCSGQA